MILKHKPITADEIREAFIQYFIRVVDDEEEPRKMANQPEITEEDKLQAINYYPYLIRFLDVQSDEICLAAVKKNGWTLMDVKQQTYDICLSAVKQNPTALQFVEEQYQTAKLCLMAAKKKAIYDKIYLQRRIAE